MFHTLRQSLARVGVPALRRTMTSVASSASRSAGAVSGFSARNVAIAFSGLAAAGSATAYYNAAAQAEESSLQSEIEKQLSEIEAVKAIAGTNTAFVFVKPHAVTDGTKALVQSEFEKRGFKILTDGKLEAAEIDEKKLIDQHYYAIASKATILKPHQLNVPTDKFKDKFGLEWQAALDSGKVLNALDGCAALGIDADEMDKQWGVCKKAKKLIKFGGGFYCGLIEIEGKEPVYVFNGFFMSMRSKFTAPGTSIHYYVVEWENGKQSWADFRGKVLGPTDPVEAPADSLRGMTLADWEGLGLAAMPNVGDNGVHASASPFEALAERANWLGADVTKDSFGKALIAAGISLETINAWSVDPQVILDASGKKGSLFDSVEDLDSLACISKLVELNARNK